MAIEVKNIHPDDLKAALDDPKVEVGVFDYRSAFARETEGQIKSSYPVPEKQINALATLELWVGYEILLDYWISIEFSILKDNSSRDPFAVCFVFI